MRHAWQKGGCSVKRRLRRLYPVIRGSPASAHLGHRRRAKRDTRGPEAWNVVLLPEPCSLHAPLSKRAARADAGAQGALGVDRRQLETGSVVVRTAARGLTRAAV